MPPGRGQCHSPSTSAVAEGQRAKGQKARSALGDSATCKRDATVGCHTKACNDIDWLGWMRLDGHSHGHRPLRCLQSIRLGATVRRQSTLPSAQFARAFATLDQPFVPRQWASERMHCRAATYRCVRLKYTFAWGGTSFIEPATQRHKSK